MATAPRQLWCWDRTYLPTEVQGRWFHLYLVLDVFSRKVVGFEVHDSDASTQAALLLKRTALSEGIHAMRARPVLHGDNGATYIRECRGDSGQSHFPGIHGPSVAGTST